jgi:hypothetical protein
MKVFRWLMLVPGSIFAMMLGSLAGGIAFTIFRSQSLMDAGSAFFGSFALAFVAGFIAPSKRSKTTLVFACVITFLAVLAFILSVCSNIEGFADRPTLDKVLIPVAQIMGALYALFLLPPVVIPGTTLQELWKEINALGITVVLFGILIILAGLLVGLLARTWVGLTTGLGVFTIGFLTWLFPFIHLFLRLRPALRSVAKMEEQRVIGKGICWESTKGRFFTVIKFTPNASVSGSIVRPNSAFEPYAMLTLDSPDHDSPILMPVLHRLDFLSLWRIFNEHTVGSDQEVIVTYDPDKWLGKFMPHIPIMTAPKNTVKKLALSEISPLPTSEWIAIMDSIRHYWDPPHPGRDLRATISLWWRLRK